MRREDTQINENLDIDLKDDFDRERFVLPTSLVIDDGETQKVLKYGILAAFLLHLALFL